MPKSRHRAGQKQKAAQRRKKTLARYSIAVKVPVGQGDNGTNCKILFADKEFTPSAIWREVRDLEKRGKQVLVWRLDKIVYHTAIGVIASPQMAIDTVKEQLALDDLQQVPDNKTESDSQTHPPVKLPERINTIVITNQRR